MEKKTDDDANSVTAGESSSLGLRNRSQDTSGFTSDITELLMKNLSGCDLLWSFFVAAAKSYRFSSILHPFPPSYHTNNGEEKNIFAVRDVLSRVPKLYSNPDIMHSMPKDCQELLSWVLLPSGFRLKMRDRESCFQGIKELTGQVMDIAEPNFVFEVIHSVEREKKFEQLQAGRKILYAYHGSRFDNFHSILHNGLNGHLNKVSVFGEGTYLSSELSVSLLYSHSGEGWKHSSLGGKLSCVSVCQMIDDASVKCQIKEGSAAKQKERAQASRITDAVPEKYYVVQNNDMIRVKYLLIYKQESNLTTQV